MDNKTETAMDNELDFRVGDVVCDIRHGTGKVVEIRSNDSFPIRVDFGWAVRAGYQINGRWLDQDKLRSLYHGTWEQVFGNLPDLKPKRKVKRWVNLYLAEKLSQAVKSSRLYLTENEARANANIDAVAVAVEIEVDE